MTTCNLYSCQREEQCDDCFFKDHIKECDWCEHYDHPVLDKDGFIKVRPEHADFSAKRLMDKIVYGENTHFYSK